MARHLTYRHKLEDEVDEVLRFPVRSEESKRKFERLMCLGDYYHNVDVSQSGRRELVVLRRPTSEDYDNNDCRPSRYTPCPGSLGFVKRSDLHCHTARCKETASNFDRSNIGQSSRLLLFPHNSDVTPEFQSEILGRMTTVIGTVAMKDSLKSNDKT